MQLLSVRLLKIAIPQGKLAVDREGPKQVCLCKVCCTIPLIVEAVEEVYVGVHR